MIADASAILQDRNGDGVTDYINARIYVADDATPEELAAASNIAARLAFETLSLDLPIGFPVSAYEPSDAQVAILVGRAANGIEGTSVIAIPDVADAEKFARTFGAHSYQPGALPQPRTTSPRRSSLADFYGNATKVILGPDLQSPAVIDLAARIALETTCLHLPVVVATIEGSLPANAILIGRSHPTVQRLVKAWDVEPGCGRIEVIEDAVEGKAVMVIAGSDAAGEAEAIRHAAERLPHVWDYGKDCLKLSVVEDDIRRFLSLRSPAGQAAAAFLESSESFSQLVADPPVIFEDIHKLRWEVDDALLRIEETILPQIHAGSAVELELRLSESPELRKDLSARIGGLLIGQGSDPARTAVRVFCAHKQGYSWIDEELKPRIRDAARIRIIFRELEKYEQSVDSSIRWLQELYPIDEVLAKDLGISLENILFEQTSLESGPVYEVVAVDSGGREILRSTFDPRFVKRPLFDAFPDYASAYVATGWLRATVDGVVVADERIKTDPERFWDIFQSESLRQVRDYILRIYDGKPQAECAPHFDEFTVEVALSEPDYGIGIDEERISTLEALHEDIYFETLLFFDVLGMTCSGEPLRYPGRIIPRILPAREGSGHVRVSLTGKRPSKPDRPDMAGSTRISAATVKAGHRGVLFLDVHTGTPYKEGAAMARGICDLHVKGFGSDWLSYDDVDCLRMSFSDQPGTATIPRFHRDNSYCIPKIKARRATAPIVQWKTPIGPDECERIIEELASFPEVRPFYAGMSYLGRRIWAMDVMAPLEGKYFSQTKASVTKPALFITGRQHANEVSSTSHILKLVELLATDPAYRKLLDHVNFVIHPMTNPDGAALVDELHRITPEFMLHAGYLGALGVDVTHQQWEQDPKYPEARIRADLWRMWQPDMVLNPHGYPEHEWVQLFAGYSAWMRSTAVIARDWWIPRGWFLPHFEYVGSDRELAFALLDRVAIKMENVIGPLNQRMYRRYARYGAFEPETYKMRFHKGLLVYTAEKEPSDYSEITALDVVSEAPDEIARGPWLEMVAAAGLEFSLVCARFLAETASQVQRTIEQTSEETVLQLSRKRGTLSRGLNGLDG